MCVELEIYRRVQPSHQSLELLERRERSTSQTTVLTGPTHRGRGRPFGSRKRPKISSTSSPEDEDRSLDEAIDDLLAHGRQA